MSPTLYDTRFSLYAQLVRAVMHENGIEFNSHYISLPDGEQVSKYIARSHEESWFVLYQVIVMTSIIF